MKKESQKLKVVGISGCSCSGKTNLSQNLKLKMIDDGYEAHLICQDAFYLADSKCPIDTNTGYVDWDIPEAINMVEFYNSIIQFITKFDESSSPKTILIIEGFLYFHESRFLELIDHLIFNYSDFDTLLQRRNSREGRQTLEGLWIDPENYFELVVYPSYLKYYKDIHELAQLNRQNEYPHFTFQYNNHKILFLDSGKLNQNQILESAINYIFINIA